MDQTSASSESRERKNNESIDALETMPEAVPVELTEPPIEEQLAWHTLWPESHKLYGHGNELFSVCCDHDGKLVASSCKAQLASVAEIWLWQVGTWKAVARLHSHSLTVTQLEFSHDNSFLLSVSRDRHFSIFAIKKTETDEISHQLVIKQEAHKRIIWACSWNPFGHEFATGSRDKSVKIWKLENGSSVKLLTTLPTFKSSVTALSWLGIDRKTNLGLLAVGMESGLIELWSLSNPRTENSGSIGVVPNAALVVRLDPFICHVSGVHRLRWKNATMGEDCTSAQLASCGDDHCVRVFQVSV
ncbi:elongator complex protein 2 [Phtheirospermum japonicum]|uniref:Elongator complex protein 2 n=1 Tax=Phtheirospermum japonicum TaxID=374723 RepID=A0A830DQN8_9LAMI|nr:elongator complex protein 2 [Phtheirospermum japonicum]